MPSPAIRLLSLRRGLLCLVVCSLTACTSPAPAPPASPPPQPATTPAKPAAPEPKTAAAKQPRGPIRLSDIARLPAPSDSPPRAFSFEPEGKRFAYLRHPTDSLSNTLYVQTLGEDNAQAQVLKAAEVVGEHNLSHEEKLRRERTRQMTVGVTSYRWSPTGGPLLVPSNGRLYLQTESNGPFDLIFDGKDHPVIDPKWSPDGKNIAFVRDNELQVLRLSNYLAGTADKRPAPPLRTLTAHANARGVTHGLAEYVAQEEMDRGSGYWWSQDSRMLAYTEVDDSPVPAFSVIHQAQPAKDAAQQPVEQHRYPYAGHPNARVRLGVISVNGGTTRWLDLEEPFGSDLYLARVKWLHSGKLLVVLVNRAQDQLEMRSYDPRNGRATVLLREKGDPWVNLHGLLAEIEEGQERGNLIWGSERSGYRHLYLIGKEGGVVRPLTSGPWVVTRLNAVDGAKGKVWFTGTKADPTQRHLYAVSLSGGPVEQLTKEAGTHSTTVDPDNDRFIDSYSSLVTPPVVTLRNLTTGVKQRTLYTEDPGPAKALKVTPPRLVKVRARDGEQLYGMVYTPDRKIFGNGPFPTVVSVYGGPHVQLVRNKWSSTVSMRAQFLAQNGYVVFTLDNRGSAGRGFAFETKVAHNLGDLEVKDQVDGVAWLTREGLCDPARVGIIGWSYGGYMAAMALVRAPKVFAAGVAGAPVTDWLGYDTFYTERYMGQPDKNPEGYKRAAVMTHVDNLQGRLMLVHGLVDENVHFRHTASLMNAITGANKDYDLLLYPDERHKPRRPADRLHMETRILGFFDRYLKHRKDRDTLRN